MNRELGGAVIVGASDRRYEALTISDKRVFQILDGFPIGVFVVDDTGSPYYANPAAISLLGKGLDPAAHADDLSSVYELFVAGTDDPYPTSALPIIRALAGETSHVDDMEVHGATGTIAVEVWGRPLANEEGRTVNGLALFADITERKRIEAALAKHAEELSRLNTELGRSNVELDQFAHIASHDLSEPLRSISGFVQLLARRYEGQLDEEADRFIRRTVEGTERMQRLISDILAYSAIGRVGEEVSVIDCDALITTTVEALRTTLQERNAEVIVGILPEVRGDGSKLAQLFLNLMANAVKFTAVGVTPCIEVSAEHEGNFHEFSIKDNGIGIEPQYRERIFRMFQRLNKQEDFAGTGIGLAICKKIVERHGGRIWVQESLSGGADFRFTLPVSGNCR